MLRRCAQGLCETGLTLMAMRINRTDTPLHYLTKAKEWDLRAQGARSDRERLGASIVADSYRSLARAVEPKPIG
jgi:hypothetical protein